jgi:hypothetical protein
VIPVEVTQAPWHATGFWDWVDHWQTGLAGAGAVIAAFLTIWVTRRIANRQIAASRADADRVITATRDQTKTTIRLQEMRDASEASAFHAMLEAAMARVLAEAASARKTCPQVLTLKEGMSADGLAVRQCITKGAFAELRAACVTQGGPLTGEFLDLEREIDSFASQWHLVTSPMVIETGRKGKHAGLSDSLTRSKGGRANCGGRPPSGFDDPHRDQPSRVRGDSRNAPPRHVRLLTLPQP